MKKHWFNTNESTRNRNFGRWRRFLTSSKNFKFASQNIFLVKSLQHCSGSAWRLCTQSSAGWSPSYRFGVTYKHDAEKGDSLTWSLYGATLNIRNLSWQFLPPDTGLSFHPSLKDAKPSSKRCTTRASSKTRFNTPQAPSERPNSSVYAGHCKRFSNNYGLAEDGFVKSQLNQLGML